MSVLSLRQFFRPSTCRYLAQPQRRALFYATKTVYGRPPIIQSAKAKQVDGPELPPISEWRKHFPSTLSMHRVFIRNPDTADLLANAFVPEGSKDKVIIEGYPGPGQLTRSLLKLPKERISKIIVLESDEIYAAYLRALAKSDPRVIFLEMDAFNWATYETISSMGLLDEMAKMPWTDGVHPQLQFISHIPTTVLGDQLVAQLMRSIPDQQWLFQYGRIPMNFLLTQALWKRVKASAGNNNIRCKLSVIAEATAKCTDVVDPSSLEPFSDHFHPTRSNPGEVQKNNARRVGNPFQAVSVLPLEDQYIKRKDLDVWDYVLRRLFVQKATALRISLPAMAPGAKTLLKAITNPELPASDKVDQTKTPRQMTVNDWAQIVKAFQAWPFAPENLSIDLYTNAKNAHT